MHWFKNRTIQLLTLGINDNILRRWLKELSEPDKTAVPGNGSPRDEEVARLNRELAEVKRERDFLSEAAVDSNGQSNVLRQESQVKFHMIERYRDVFPIKMMCHLLEVSTSGYYAWRNQQLSKRAQDNARLSRKITDIHRQSDGVFGGPRIRNELVYAGERCSLNRVARLMKCHQLVGIPALKQWRNRKSELRPVHMRNHLERDFSATEPN